MKHLIQLIISIGAGALGGWLFGFIILSFGAYIGRSGDRGVGQEGPGYWNPMVSFGLAGFYGMPLGALMFPLGYLIFLQEVPLPKALVCSAAGTLIAGLCGALIEPPVAALFGVIGFFIGAFIASRQ